MESVRGYAQGALNFLNSDGLVPQLLLTVIILIVLQVVLVTLESVVESIRNYNRLQVTILKDTHTSDYEEIFDQSSTSNKPYIYPSNNEVEGIEFSYSFHLFVDPATFSSGSSTGKFRTVFYKGSKSHIWPSMNPGVFISTETNTLRVYQNAVNGTKDTMVDIPNIPVKKWFHVVITQKGQNMDVYINGNVASRLKFNTIPKLNFGNVMVFSKNTLTNTDSQIHGDFSVAGPMIGSISRLTYYAYALNFAQIDNLYRQGPSTKIISKSMDQTPPYFHDSWWVTRFR